MFSFLPCSACFSWLGIADSILGLGNSFVLLVVLVFVSICFFLNYVRELIVQCSFRVFVAASFGLFFVVGNC